MEPRAAIGELRRGDGRYTLHVGCQGVFGLQRAAGRRRSASTPEKVRVLTGNVGGSFGMKGAVFPEYVCVLHAARALGRPVKWTDERSGSFLSDHHGRDHEMTGELALDNDGHIPRAARSPATAMSAPTARPMAPLHVDRQRRQERGRASTARR